LQNYDGPRKRVHIILILIYYYTIPVVTGMQAHK
jgi:hypothetical protein